MASSAQRRVVQEEASLAGFRLDEAAVKRLLTYLADGGEEEDLQGIFGAVDTGMPQR